jgi:hypothetical protein
MHGPAGLPPPPAAEPACPVPDPASRAPITTSIGSLANRLRQRYQFNFQATSLAIKIEPITIETGYAAEDGARTRNLNLGKVPVRF